MIVIRRNYLMGCISLLGVFIIGVFGCGEDNGGLVTEADGSGHEAGVLKGPPPKVVSVNISEGQKVPNDEVLIIVAKFNKKMEEATISVSNAAGLRFSSGKEATWMSMEAIPVGPHTLTIRGWDTFRQDMEEFEPIHFFVTGGASVDDVPDEEKGPAPRVESVSISPGQEMAGNKAIVITFTKEMGSVQVEVSDAAGITALNDSQAVWTPAEIISPGSHTLTVEGKDIFGQPLGTFEPVPFLVTEPDVTPPSIDGGKCNPKNGALNLDTEKYKGTTIFIVAFTEPLESAKIVFVRPHLNSGVLFGIIPNPDRMARLLTVGLLIKNFDKIPKGIEVQIVLELQDKAGNVARDEYIFSTIDA